MRRGIEPGDLNAVISVRCGRRHVGAAIDNQVLQRRIAKEAEQADVAVAVLRAVTILCKGRVSDADISEVGRAAPHADAADDVGLEDDRC